MKQSLIDILCCPVTRSALRAASPGEIGAVNDAIAEDRAADAAGRPVRQRLDAALVTLEGDRFYRVEDGIPVLLADECIRLGSTGAAS